MTTLFAPVKMSELGNDILKPTGQGFSFTAAASSTTNYDFQITEDSIFLGGRAILSGHQTGDSLTVQVIDKDGIYSPPNTIVGQPFTTWYVAGDVATQGGLEAKYPAKVLAGLYIRVAYTSTSILSPVAVRFNLEKHKVLA